MRGANGEKKRYEKIGKKQSEKGNGSFHAPLRARGGLFCNAIKKRCVFALLIFVF